MTPWMLKLWEDGVGTASRVEDTTKETVSTHSVAEVKARAKAKETVTLVDHQGVIQVSALTHNRTKIKTNNSKHMLQLR